MIKYFAKRWTIKQLNSLLDCLKSKQNTEVWKARISKILAFLQKVMSVLEDNVVSDEEADQVIDEAKKLFE